MEIKINIEKSHLYIFSVIVGILIGVFIVNAFGTNSPSNFGHSVGELDWSQRINSDVDIGGAITVNGQRALSSDATSIKVGDLAGGDGPRDLMLRAGDKDSVIIYQNGDIVIQGTLDIFYRGLTRKTEQRWNGNLGGRAGADAKCAAEFGAGWEFYRQYDHGTRYGYTTTNRGDCQSAPSGLPWVAKGIPPIEAWYDESNNPGDIGCSDWTNSISDTAYHTNAGDCNGRITSANICSNARNLVCIYDP